MTKVLLTIMLVILLQSCTNHNQSGNTQPQPKHVAPTVNHTKISTACNIIHYYQLISVLNDAQEKQAAETLLSKTSGSGKLSDCNQIKLAILLSAPGSGLQDDKTSLELLSDFIQTAQSITQADLTFATLLKEFVEERSLIRYQHTKTRDLLILQQQETKTLKENLTKTRQQLQQLKSLESELNHQEKRISEDSAS
ncbi:MAG: hypothetical protein V3V22_01165 [Methylococcales bacterium]